MRFISAAVFILLYFNLNAGNCIEQPGDLPDGTLLKCENFDALDNSGIVAQDPINWKKWEPAAPDAEVINNPNGTGKVLRIEDSGRQPDVLFLLGDKTSGRYRVSWKIRIETGKTGYYNIQHNEEGAPGNYAAEFNYNVNGSGELRVLGINEYYSFKYFPEVWNTAVHIIDLDNKIAEFWINDRFVAKWDFGNGDRGELNQLGAINFYAFSGADYFVDDICFWESDCTPALPLFVNNIGNRTLPVICLDNMNTFQNEEDARCALYTSGMWSTCQTICERGGPFIRRGDRYSETIDESEPAPSLLYAESCVMDDFGGIDPPKLFAEIFLLWHPSSGPITLESFEAKNSSGNIDSTSFNVYLFECVCPSGGINNCNKTAQKCLGSLKKAAAGNFDNVPEGFYYVIVLSSEIGSFEFNIGPDDNVCQEEAEDLRCGDMVSGSLSGEDNTFDLADAFDAYSGCYSGNQKFTGGDKYFALTLEKPQKVDISLDALEPVGLFLYNLSCGNGCFTYDETDFEGNSPRLTVNLSKGIYYLIIDKATPGGTGNYTLSINCSKAGSSPVFVSNPQNCPLDLGRKHDVTIRRSANPSILGILPQIQFLYENEIGRYQVLDTVSAIYNGADEMLFSLPADADTDSEKCSYLPEEKIQIILKDISKTGNISSVNLEFLDPDSGGTDAEGSFQINGTSVITKISIDSSESFNVQPPFLSLSANADINTQAIFINPSFQWTYSLPPDSDWLTLDFKSLPRSRNIFAREPNAIFVTAAENTSPAPRSTTLQIKSVESIPLQIDYVISQGGSCVLPDLRPVLNGGIVSPSICPGRTLNISFDGIRPEWEDLLEVVWEDGSIGFEYTVVARQPGVNEIHYTVRSKKCTIGKPGLVSFNVNTPPDAPISNGDRIICENQPIPALSVVSLPFQIVDWYDSEASTEVIASGPSFTPSEQGTYFAEVRSNFPGNNCKSPKTPISLKIVEKPTAISDRSQMTVCEGESINLNGSVTGSTYTSWSDNNAGGSFSDPNDPVTVYTPPPINPNNIILTLTANDTTDTCPSGSHSIRLHIPSKIDTTEVRVSGSSGSDGSIFISVAGGTPPYLFEWQKAGIIFSNNAEIINLTPGDYFVTVTDSTGCIVRFGPIEVPLITALQTAKTPGFVKVFPNPAGSKLFIETSENALKNLEFQFFNAIGKSVRSPIRQQTSPTEIRLDVSKFFQGVYFLKINLNGKITTEKIIIK